MIIITEKAGRLGNKLVLYSHFISFHSSYRVPVINVTLDEDAELFESTSRDLFCRYPAKKSLIKPSIYLRKKIYRAAVKMANIIERIGIGKSFINVINIDTNESVSLDDPKYIRILKRTPIVFIKGYQYRHKSGYVDSGSKIKEYFKPKENISTSINNKLNILKEKSDIIVGIHIRQGDYRNFMGGQWYFTTAQYVEVMHRLTELLNPAIVGFLVCSNVKQDLQDFSNLCVEFGSESAVEDMYALSQCDYIVGPPSSYNSWSAFYGDVPIYYLSISSTPSSLDEFKKYLIPNC